MKKILKSKVIVVLIALFAIASIGAIWQSVMVDYERDKYKPISIFCKMI